MRHHLGEMSTPSRSPKGSGRRKLLGGLGAAAFLGVLGSAIRSLFGGEAAPVETSSTALASSAPPAATSGGTTSASSATPVTTDAPAASTEPESLDIVSTKVLVIEKAGWGAAQEREGLVEHEITGIVVHHTAVVLGSNSEAPGRARGHQRFHQDQGWADLAYHLLIDREGNIYEGRPLWARGDTFTEYDPTGFFLPALEGDFNTETPSGRQLESLAAVCAWAARRWNIDPEAILGHRDLASTTCPGENLYPHVAGGDLTARVQNLIEDELELVYLRGHAALDLVAEIEAGG